MVNFTEWSPLIAVEETRCSHVVRGRAAHALVAFSSGEPDHPRLWLRRPEDPCRALLPVSSAGPSPFDVGLA